MVRNKLGYKYNGFTLVELLVVISVIALLLAILMPALQKARDHAKRIVCSSRLHQIGITQLSYAADCGKLFPRYVTVAEMDKDAHINFSVSVTTVVPFVLTEHFWDYIKTGYSMEAESWVCPSLASAKGGQRGFIDEAGNLKPRHLGSAIWPNKTVGIGYAHLVGLCNMQHTDPSPDVPESAHGVTDRSSKVLAADLNLRWEDWDHKLSAIAHRGRDGLPVGGNSLYLDGSVAWRKASQLGKDDESVGENNEAKFRHTDGSFGIIRYPRAYYW
jgi:prepilin-type N-terminal cleavage/methylation domain-containing protein